MLAEPGHFSQYSKTSFRHWGMKVVWPFVWFERRLALKIGLVAVRIAIDGGDGVGRSVTANGRVTGGCVTSDIPPLTVNQERERGLRQNANWRRSRSFSPATGASQSHNNGEDNSLDRDHTTRQGQTVASKRRRSAHLTLKKQEIKETETGFRQRT